MKYIGGIITSYIVLLVLDIMIATGNPLKLSSDFSPLHTVRATFTAHGVPPFMIRY